MNKLTTIASSLALTLYGSITLAQSVECSGLLGVQSEASTIIEAKIVEGGSQIEGSSVRGPICRVRGVARPSSDSEIKFEVWLPTVAAWTGRMKLSGTGGFAGGVPYASLARDVGDGFVAAGSNMGHDGGESPSWTMGHPEKVKDWGLRAHYYVATAAKSLANAHYGKPVDYSYFAGCSNGGRQALLLAQNYPKLFNGIVAVAPSNYYPDLLFWLIYSGKVQKPEFDKPPVLSADKQQLINQRVIAACDAVDGVTDGQVTNPRACKFDVDSLGPKGDRSLSEVELATAKAMYAGTLSEAGQQRYPGVSLGSEKDWAPNFADNGGYGTFVGHFVYGTRTPPFQWRKDINFSGVYDKAFSALTPFTSAPSPDLKEFRANGGKLIQLHGWNDPLVPPTGSIAYHRSVAVMEDLRALPAFEFDRIIDELTPDAVRTSIARQSRNVNEFHRLFMMPGVAHCGGSVGADAVGGGMTEPPESYRKPETHSVNALMQWVEGKKAPEKIVATKFNGNTLVHSRPICAWPAQAKYIGSGDANDAKNFRCEVVQGLNESVEESEMLLIRSALRQRDVRVPNR